MIAARFAYSAQQTSEIKPIIRDTTFNSRKVQEHHAIVPLATTSDLNRLTPGERNIYLLVAAHYPANFMRRMDPINLST